MRSNGPLANKEVAMGGRGWPGGLVACWPGHSSRLAESGRLVRRMSHHVDPAAIAEEARAVRLDAVLGPPRRSVPVGDSLTLRICSFLARRNSLKNFRALATRRRHRRQPETPNVWVRGANGRRVSRGRFRVVGCGAFRLGFGLCGAGGPCPRPRTFASLPRSVGATPAGSTVP